MTEKANDWSAGILACHERVARTNVYLKSTLNFNVDFYSPVTSLPSR